MLLSVYLFSFLLLLLRWSVSEQLSVTVTAQLAGDCSGRLREGWGMAGCSPASQNEPWTLATGT